LRPGDIIVATLPGAVQTKIRPAVVISSDTYLVERPDVIVGILTTRLPVSPAATDYTLLDWREAGLRAQSCFRAYVLTLHRSNATVIGRLSQRDWAKVQQRVRIAFGV
jgi:mRNA interferase MazF